MLSQDQFLPGTEHMLEAKPHEQTEAQFHNRPDVFVHGRYWHRSDPGGFAEPTTPSHVIAEMHAGTEASAHERLDYLGSPYSDHVARFYHGRVDPMKMQNTANLGKWEGAFPVGFDGALPGRNPSDPGRIPDQIDGWQRRHRDSYYRNDYEDKGSTSVILSSSPQERNARDPLTGGTYQHTVNAPNNFTTWRQGVTQALQAGKHVPAHVRATYEASGGAEGSHGNVHTDFKPVYTPKTFGHRGPADLYRQDDLAIPGIEHAISRAQFGDDAFN